MRYFTIALSAAFTSIVLVACGGGSDVAPPSMTGSTLGQEGAVTPVLASYVTKLSGNIVNGTDYWKSPTVPGGTASQSIDGVTCLLNENYHVHAHLTIILDGGSLAVPSQIGLQGCAYEVHTHDRSGILHVETDQKKIFTLGQVFSLWGQPLSSTNIAGITTKPLLVLFQDDGQIETFSGDPRSIELRHHRKIFLILGKVPATVPNYLWPADL